MATLFISYSTKDRSTAEIFYEKLVEMGYESPFRDDHPGSGIPAGADWEQELYRKLKLCKALIVLCSENWLDSKWCFAELAYAKGMGKEIFPVVIDDDMNLPSIIGQRQAIHFSSDDIWKRLRRGLTEADLAPNNDFAWPVASFDECPFPGLSAFEAHHAGVYFGRDEETLELRERLNQMTSRGKPRLLYVIGASGSGKSSLVRAGLLPRLTRKEVQRWCVLRLFRWNSMRSVGRSWPEQLAFDLLGAWPSDGVVRPDWRALRERYSGCVERAAECFIDDTKELLYVRNQPDATPLFVIDQFEEILSTAEDDSVKRFLTFLGCVMSSPDSPWRCIVTVRSDFLSAIQTCSELVAWKEETDVYSLPLMNTERFYEVIRRPAEKVGISFASDALVDRIASDTGTNDALPLLAFTLREMWLRDHSHFSFESYEQVGGIAASVKCAAERIEADANLSSELERDAQKSFLQLAQVNEDGNYTRRAARWSSLPKAAHPLLERLLEARLLVSFGDGDERMVEVAHESLFRVWTRLANWLAEAREFLLWKQRTEREALEWERRGLERGFLLREERLSEAVRWSENELSSLTPTASEFIERSRLAGHQKRVRRIALVVSSFVILTCLTSYALVSRQNAVSFAQVAMVQRLAAEADASRDQFPERSLLLAVEAVRRGHASDRSRAEQSLRQTLASVGGSPLIGEVEPVDALNASPDGHYIAAAVRDWGAFVWQLDQRHAPPVMLPEREGFLTALAFAPDSEKLATGSFMGFVRLWNVSDPDAPQATFQHANTITGLEVLKNGRLLACSLDGVVSIWDPHGQGVEPVRRLQHKAPINGMALDNNERRLAVVDRLGTLTVWDLDETADEPIFVCDTESSLEHVLCSNDGRVFTAAKDGTIRLCNLDDNQSETVLLEPAQTEVEAMELSPNGRYLASCRRDGVVKVWDTLDLGKQPTILRHRGEAMVSLAIDDQSKYLAAGGLDPAIHLWNLDDLSWEAELLRGHEFPVLALDFVPGRRVLVSGDSIGRIRVWDVDSPFSSPRILTGHTDRISCMGVDGASQILVTASSDKTARIWKLGEFDKPSQLLEGHESYLENVVVTPDGRFVITSGSWDGTIRVWSSEQGFSQAVVLNVGEYESGHIVVSPDGRYLFAAGLSGVVRRWDLFDLTEPVFSWQAHGEGIRDLAFAGGSRLVTCGSDARARVWDLADTSAAIMTFDDHNLAVNHVRIAGDRIVTDDVGGTIRVWDINDPKAPPVRLGRVNGPSEPVVSPDERLLAVDSGAKVLVWDLHHLDASRRILPGTNDLIQKLGFSPDGRSIVAAELGRVLIWNVGQLDAAPVRINLRKEISSIAFSPDGRWLIVGCSDGTVQVLTLEVQALIAEARRVLSRNLLEGEWLEYFSGERYTKTFADLPGPLDVAPQRLPPWLADRSKSTGGND